MPYTISAQAAQYVKDNEQALVELISHLCTIPAPSNHEELRAEYCKKWLEEAGAQGVYIDPALNVIYPYGCEGRDDLAVIMAHTDTVFPDLEPLPQRRENGRLYCPGVGDDTANLAVLMLLCKYVAIHKPQLKRGLLLVCNSGEEGLGNLKGSRQLMKDYAGRVTEFISLDGSYTSICNRAVGSTRYRVEMLTEGGHSYGAFGNRNAIHLLSSLIGDLYTIKVPVEGDSKTTYNVGAIHGGTSVNTIAQQAEMLYEYRSDSKACLDKMEQFFLKVVDMYRAMGVTVNVEVIGQRPCMGEVDASKQQALLERCSDIIRAATGVTPPTGSGSTDCNIPFSLGIPSLCFGAYIGHGAHTREEYIELDSLPAGFAIIMTLFETYLA